MVDVAMPSPLDAPVLSERLFFPARRCPPAVFPIEVDGATLACARHRTAPDAPLVVHFHGNGETAADYVPDLAGAFAAAGLDSLFVEYRGYGGSTGTPALVGMLDDAVRVIDALDTPLDRVIVYGRSIGSIYAIEAAHRRPAIRALVIESGIADPLERIVVRVDPRELGLDREELLREVARHLDHGTKLAGYPGHVLVLHAAGDDLIDISHARRNAAAARDGELVVFERGDHNTILAYNADAIVEAVARLAPA